MFSRDQVLALMRERVHHPAAMRELLQILKVPRDERTTFKRHIKSLVAAGELIQIRGHRFGLPEKMDVYVGKLQTHPNGFGFVTPERPLDSGGDIYISGPLLNEAMNGDRVVVRIERIKDGGKAEGRIIRIIERANESIVGRYERGDDGMGYVAPFDRRVLMDIFVPPGQEGGASPGDMVIVELTRWPTATRGAIGRVAEVLGDIDKPGVDTEIIIRKWGIPDAHSSETIAEAGRLVGANSDERMTSTAVNGILTEKDPELIERYRPLVPMFELMRELFQILNDARRRRGSIDFDLNEAEVIIDEGGQVEAIIALQRNVAHRLIQGFLLLANQPCATYLEAEQAPALYRVHEEPDILKVAKFEDFISGFGYSLAAPVNALRPRHF